MTRVVWGFQLLMVTVLLVGCTGKSIVPVSDLTSARSQHAARIVRAGDTLYMIAWEVGLDYRLLAKWNELQEPFTLTVGERVRLTEPGESTVGKDSNGKILVRKIEVPIVRGSGLDVDSEGLDFASIAETSEGSAVQLIKRSRWSWPADGIIISEFTGKKGNNGIDIAGQAGNPVRASAAGTVVYAGSGLRGYGKLLILQHDEVFLSAYAHNRRLLVQEGYLAEQGQTIAEMGDTDAESARLHFEIRRNGKPVDPLSYLPPRD